MPGVEFDPILGALRTKDGLALTTVATITNLIPNPSWEADTPGSGNSMLGGWTYYGGTGTYSGPSTGFGEYGIQSYEVADTSATMDGGIYVQLTGLTSGQTYTFSVWVNTSSGVVNANIILDTSQHSAGGSTTVQSHQGGSINQRASLSITMDATKLNIFLGQGSFGTTSQGTVYYDGAMLVLGSAPPSTYIDGGQAASAPYSYAWTGTANNSTSTRTTSAYNVGGYGLTDVNAPSGNSDAATMGYAVAKAGDTMTGPLVIEDSVSSSSIVFQVGNTPLTRGAFVVQNNTSNRYANGIAVYDSDSGAYYGIGTAFPVTQINGHPFIALGGYYNGLGIGGTSSGGTQPIFGVLNSSQSGNGLGATAFTIQDNNQVYTFHNTLDDGSGNMGVYDGGNIVLGTTTGTKIGTGTSQKLAFYNSTPIVQPTTGIAAASFVANTSGTLNDSATWGGYTIGQVVQALRNFGLLA